MSIPRRTSKKKEASRVDESQARTRASLLRKNKARKMKKPYPPGRILAKGGTQKAPRESKNTLYLKALERGSSVFRLKVCTGR